MTGYFIAVPIAAVLVVAVEWLTYWSDPTRTYSRPWGKIRNSELWRLLMGWQPIATNPDHGFVAGDHVTLGNGFAMRVARINGSSVIGRWRYRGATSSD